MPYIQYNNSDGSVSSINHKEEVNSDKWTEVDSIPNRPKTDNHESAILYYTDSGLKYKIESKKVPSNESVEPVDRAKISSKTKQNLQHAINNQNPNEALRLIGEILNVIDNGD